MSRALRTKNKPNGLRLIILVAIAVVVGIANIFYRPNSAPEREDEETVMMGAEFRTLGGCMLSLRGKLGSQLSILTDEPDNVSGQQSDGTNWACTRKHTGTKGIYWEGWYEARN